MLYSRALAGKLQPLSDLLRDLDATAEPAGARARIDMDRLSAHLGIPIRKASPEALAALARARGARG